MTNPVRLSRTLKTAPPAPSPRRERTCSEDSSPDHETRGADDEAVVVLVEEAYWMDWGRMDAGSEEDEREDEERDRAVN